MVSGKKFPVDWEVDILGHRVRIETGGRNTEDKKENGKYPFFVRSQKVEQIDTYHYDCEAILTAGDGVGTGKVFHYYNGKFDAHQRVYVLSEFDRVIGRYLYYYFKMNFLNEVEKYTAKSSVDSVRRDMIAKMPIPIPSRREQDAIAETLSDVDSLIVSLQKLIDKKKAIKQGTMQELLTGKKRLPGYSEEWKRYILKDVCLVLNGDRGNNYPADSEFVDIGIPFVNAGHLRNGVIDFSNMDYITEWKYQNMGGAKIEKNDILICLRGSLGKYAICEFDNGALASSLALLRSNEKHLLSCYLFQTLGYSDFEKKILQENNGSSQPNLSAGSIKTFDFLLPNIKEQKAISQVLTDMDIEIKQLEKKLAKYRQIKQGMMQELLTGHIRLVEAKHQEKNKIKEPKEKSSQNHNQHFDDAVMIAGIVDAFYSEKYPLGRKKIQKLLYLVRRKEQADISSFHKKAAGPYADIVRYKGGEPIAKKNGYIQEMKSKKGSSFSKGKQIQQALNYLREWNKQQDIEWLLSEFQYTKVDELELLATVDMAACDLYQEGKDITVQTIKNLIQSTNEWRDKLKKTYFSDTNIQRAIKECRELFNDIF